MAGQRQIAEPSPAAYATCVDFCRIFHEEMDGLYSLALLLTADHERAEDCFIRSLEGSLDGPPVFKEWAKSWTRRTVILYAIEISAAQPAEPASIAKSSAPNCPTDQVEIAALFSLQALERFAFVMSVLERYSDQECSLLLACSRKEVHSARIRALEQIANALTDQRDKRTQGGTGKAGSFDDAIALVSTEGPGIEAGEVVTSPNGQAADE